MPESNLAVMEKELERDLERLNPLLAIDPLREFRMRPFGGLFEDIFAPLRADVPSIPASWMPRADIQETDKEYVIDLSLPGIRKEDVKVEVTDDVLSVSGERRREKEEKGKAWLRRESSYGSFLRSFTLPEGLHTEDIKAVYRDGVLTLSMLKPPQAKSRAVNIKVD